MGSAFRQLTLFFFCSFTFLVLSIKIADLLNLRTRLVKLGHIHRCDVSNEFEEVGFEPVLYCNRPLLMTGFGNHGGLYFEGIACADLVRAHFVNVGFIENNKFLIALPQVIVHEDPNLDSFMYVNHTFHSECQMMQLPWKSGGAWEDRPNYLKSVIRSALLGVYANVSNVLLNTSDFEHMLPLLNRSVSAPLPMIPDAVILFRCIDIIQLSWDVYGFLSFKIYDDILPRRTATIYIITEQEDYQIKLFKNSTSYVNGQRVCKELVHRLADYLHAIRPAATVAIRRGNPIEGFLMLSLARYTICAPSTFCLWSGLTNDHYVFFTPGKVCLERNFLHERFFWVESPRLILLSAPFKRGVGVDELVRILKNDTSAQGLVVKNFVTNHHIE